MTKNLGSFNSNSQFHLNEMIRLNYLKVVIASDRKRKLFILFEQSDLPVVPLLSVANYLPSYSLSAAT